MGGRGSAGSGGKSEIIKTSNGQSINIAQYYSQLPSPVTYMEEFPALHGTPQEIAQAEKIREQVNQAMQEHFSEAAYNMGSKSEMISYLKQETLNGARYGNIGFSARKVVADFKADASAYKEYDRTMRISSAKEWIRRKSELLNRAKTFRKDSGYHSI